MHGRVLITALPDGSDAHVATFLEALGYWRWEHGADAGAMLTTLPAMPPGTFVQAPLPYSPDVHRAAEAARVSIVFVYRDPRDAFAGLPRARVEASVPPEPRSSSGPAPGDDGLLTRLVEQYTAARGWLTADGVLVIRAEDVGGPGGSVGSHVEVLVGLADRVGWRGRVSALLEALCQTLRDPADRRQRRTPDQAAPNGLGGVASPLVSPRLVELARAWGYSDAPDLSSRVRADTHLRWLLDGLRQELAALAADRRQLIGEALDRAETVRRLERRVTSLAAESRHHAAESEDRLAAIRRLEVRLADATALSEHYERDSEARLRVIRELERRLMETSAAREHLERDGARRLELIRQLEARLAAAASPR